jgi:hypothetical protein
MSNNAVFCISNNNKSVRLTVYRCKPNIFLNQLEKLLGSILNNGNDINIDELVEALIENGFDLDSENSENFTAADMCTSTLVNWAWLLDLENNTLKYWDVTAALNGMQDTIEQESISPMDFCNWIGSDAVADFKESVNASESKLKEIGITITNY